METFIRVARAESFAVAAGQLGISRAAASKQLAQLEDDVGLRLLNRTTRRLSLTEAGQSYFDVCARILDEIHNEEQKLVRDSHEPRGSLRIIAPKSFGALHLGGVISEFSQIYPNIRISLFLNDQSLTSMDFLDRGIDLALRTSTIYDSSLVSRTIADLHWVPVAAPSYLKLKGEPESVKDLLKHNCLVHSRQDSPHIWHFDGPNGQESVHISGSVESNSVIILRNATLSGLGISLLPLYCIGGDVKARRLKRLLARYKHRAFQFNVLYPRDNNLPAKVHFFVDFLADRLKTLT